MKRFFIIAFVLFCGSITSIAAQDLVILRDGNVIEAKVAEISPTEIRYRRFNHLSGPVIVIARSDVLSIRYENKTVEIINPLPTGGQGNQSDIPGFAQSGEVSPLQQIINSMPAITIAGNSLKFDFRGDTWVARVNGENFFAGTVEFEATAEGGTLTLKQTHIWPGAAGKTAGRVANVIPGGGAAGNALNTAGNIAGAGGPVEMSGPVIVLGYKAGPPASLVLVSTRNEGGRTTGNNTGKAANARNNLISVEVTYYIGIGARYERMLNSNISIGANFYYGIPPMQHQSHYSYCEINAFFRVYPWGKTFFLGLGLGYHYGWGDYYFSGSYWNGSGYSYYDAHSKFSNHRFTIIPEIGWKLDIGKPGGFYIMPCITFPIDFGEYDMYYDYALKATRLFYLGIGFAF